jgi:hypothetical protein
VPLLLILLIVYSLVQVLAWLLLSLLLEKTRGWKVFLENYLQNVTSTSPHAFHSLESQGTENFQNVNKFVCSSIMCAAAAATYSFVCFSFRKAISSKHTYTHTYRFWLKHSSSSIKLLMNFITKARDAKGRVAMMRMVNEVGGRRLKEGTG